MPCLPVTQTMHATARQASVLTHKLHKLSAGSGQPWPEARIQGLGERKRTCWQRRNMMRVEVSLSSRVSGLLQLLHSTYLHSWAQ